MERQVLLAAADGLVSPYPYPYPYPCRHPLSTQVGAAPGPAYAAVAAGSVFPGLMARFKKKEDVGTMTKSILKHKIQTLTGHNVKTIEEEMDYRPKDPNEPSMDVDTMRQLQSCLILLSNGELPAVAREDVGQGRKRAPSPEAEEREAPPAKAPRRSLAVQEPAASPARRGRRSLAAIPSQPAASPAR